MLGGRAGGRVWWRESPASTLFGRRENERGGVRLPPNAGRLTALIELRTLMKDVICTKENYSSDEKCLQFQFCKS